MCLTALDQYAEGLVPCDQALGEEIRHMRFSPSLAEERLGYVAQVISGQAKPCLTFVAPYDSSL